VRIAFCAIASLAIAILATAPDAFAQGATLERIKQVGRMKIGYRADARPFSYRDESGNPAGYSVALGQKIAAATKAELGLANLPVEWVPVTAENRFQALQQGEVDLLCGAETVTLGRRAEVAFSIPIFAGGIGALLRADAPAELKDVLAGQPPQATPLWRGKATQVLQAQKFSVVAGTTAQQWLSERMDQFKVTAAVTPVDDYEAGVQRLLARKSSVFFGDRAILLDAAKRTPNAADLMLHDRHFTDEALALALQRGDEDFRLLVDRTLSRVYRTGEIREVYSKYIGETEKNVLAFFEWNALPD
jgi:ABC-type amino acid transport substrate-binding protein